MRKFEKESTAPEDGGGRVRGGWLQNHGALAVLIVAILALVLRTAFSYGVSADGNYALSGGSDAQYHLHIIESILNGSFILGNDAAINYPIGGLNINPPLYDFIAAGVASFGGASFALAVLAPIFGALTVFPVYLIGKELKGVKIGVLAALIYALMALPISSSVFSNGTEFSFTAFLFAFFILVMIKMSRKLSDDMPALKEAAVAGILLGLIALSWNGFRSILVLVILVMVIQLLIDRFNSKDFSAALYSYSAVMVIGVAIAALYYIPAGLWDAVFSGAVLITVTAVVFGFIFKAVQSRPWIFTVPALVVAFAVVTVVLFLVDGNLGNALIFGNSPFDNPIMADLAKLNVSISAMSSYYGWVLMWMPLAAGVYTLYIYAKKDRSNSTLFLAMFMLIPWIFAWTSIGACIAAGPVFAVSSAMAIVFVLAKADLKSYWSSIKSAGFPGLFKKIVKPLPFVSVIVAVFLIAVPGCIYAVDAGIPSNDTHGYFAYGNTTYTIQTGEAYPMTHIYGDIEEIADKDTGILSWINSSADIAALGYKTVNDKQGTGATAAAHIYLAEGGAGAAAAQTIRLIISNPETSFSSAFPGHTDVYEKIAGYINDPSTAVDEVLDNRSDYGKINTDITKENAVYFASIKAMNDNMSVVDIMHTYDSVCSQANEKIGYYIVDGSMLPLVYGDGDSLATMAYFGGYSTDKYGAATQFFSLITYYSNYYPAMGTDALYGTFLWKALIGPAPSDVGYSSSFSYLYDLTTSDGDVKPMPGYGLTGYEIASWYVKYNADATATTSDDGWEYMKYDDAIAAQNRDGGLINYLSSIIMYKYVGLESSTVTSKVLDNYDEPLSGITVQVISFDPKYEATTVYSECKTDKNGAFSVPVPQGAYMFVLKNGSVKLNDHNSADVGPDSPIVIECSTFSEQVRDGDTENYSDYMYTLSSGDLKYQISAKDGLVSSDNAVGLDGKEAHIIPGTYSYALIDENGTSVASGTVTLYEGANEGLRISLKTYNITANVTDFFGQKLKDGKVIAINDTTHMTYEADVEDGKAVIKVPTGKYTLRMADGYVTTNSTSLNITSNRSVNVTAYSSFGIDLVSESELPEFMTVYGGNYSALIIDGKDVYVPSTQGATKYSYTFYGTNAGQVYWGQYTDGTQATINTSKAFKVSGNIGSSGVVNFISGTMVLSATADKEGDFSMLLPGLSFTVWAYTDSNNVYLSTMTVSEDKDMGKIEMESGRKVNATYDYKSGTSKSRIGLPWTPLEITFTKEEKTWTLNAVSDSSGKATFVIPRDSTDAVVKANGGSIDNGAFKSDDLTYKLTSGSGTATALITIDTDELVKTTIYSDYEITLTPYGKGEEDKIEYTGPMELAPGQYAAKVNAKTGHYFDGTIYVYPGSSTFAGLNVLEVYGVEIEKFPLDNLEITGEKSHNNYNDDNIYYFEYDCEYFLETRNPSTGYMKNAYLNVASGETPVEKIDMSTDGRVIQLQGFVGAIADGDVTITYGDVKLVEEVKSGSFSVTVPESTTDITFEAKVTKTINSQKFGFSGTVTLKDTSKRIVNIPVRSDDSAVDYEKDNLDARIDSADFKDGKGTVTVTIFNNTDQAQGYSVTSGTAWILDDVVQVQIAAHESATVKVTGVYEPNGTGIGSVGMSVIVSDFNGTTNKTLRIVDGTDEEGSTITMKTAATCDNKDKLSGAEYLYALTFYNSGQASPVKVFADVPEGYSACLMSEGGEYIKDLGSSFIVPAQSSVIVYVKVMKTDGDMDQAPSITVYTDYSAEKVNLTPSSIDINVDSMDVSGDTAVSVRAGVPAGVWFILGVCVLLLILIVWMGSKRGGVFPRK